MATRGRGGNKRSGGSNDNAPKLSGLGAAVAVTGGAIVGAALVYGAKKLYDYVTQEEKAGGYAKKPQPGGASSNASKVNHTNRLLVCMAIQQFPCILTM